MKKCHMKKCKTKRFSKRTKRIKRNTPNPYSGQKELDDMLGTRGGYRR